MLTKAGIEELRLSHRGLMLMACVTEQVEIDKLDALCDLAIKGLSGGWRPISEVKKDGAPYLGAHPDYKTVFMFSVKGDVWKVNTTTEIIPTHFMEMPAPPQVSQEGE